MKILQMKKIPVETAPARTGDANHEPTEMNQ